MPKEKETQAETKTKSKEKSKAKVSGPTVTLKQNGFVHGKFYSEGETVRVDQKTRDYLIKTSPEVFI